MTLPPSYLDFLQVGNGATPEADTLVFDIEDGVRGSATVETFFALTGNQNDFNGVWLNTELLQEMLESEQIVAIGTVYENNPLYLDLTGGKQWVRVLYQSANNATPRIAETFEAFVDSLWLPG